MITQIRIPIITPLNGFHLRWYYNGWHYWFFITGTIGYLTDGKKYRTTGSRTVELSSGVTTEIDAIRSILNSKEVYLYTDGGWAEIRVLPGSVIVEQDIDAYELQIKAILGSRKISATGFSPVITIPVAPAPTQCEIIIGTQIWMCANWDAAWPGSKVYANTEANRAIYGGLYKHAQIGSPGFCPAGWRIPTQADWNTLIAFIGTGGKLKEIGNTHWNSPNTDATDDYDFTALPGGIYTKGTFIEEIAGTTFQELGEHGYFWLSGDRKAMRLDYDTADITLVSLALNQYVSVRMIKDVIVTIPVTIYAGTSSTSYLLKSIDGGEIFTVVEESLVGNPMAIHIAESGDLYYTTDLGYIVNQTTQANAQVGNATTAIRALSSYGAVIICGDDEGNVYYGNEVYGFSWFTLSGIVYALIKIGGGIFCFTSSGIYEGVNLFQIGNFICAKQLNDNYILAGTQDGHLWVNTSSHSFDVWTDLGLYSDFNNGPVTAILPVGDGNILIAWDSWEHKPQMTVLNSSFVNIYNVELAYEGGAKVTGIVKSGNYFVLSLDSGNIYRTLNIQDTWTAIDGNPQQSELSINCLYA